MQSVSSASAEAPEALRRAIHVPAGGDRSGNPGLMVWGLIPFAVKLSSKDTNGEIFVFEHRHMGRYGPPRHIHYTQDEWFYIAEGEFVIEVGDEKFVGRPGDSLFAPRMVPHAWACRSQTPGTLVTTVNPVGTFEDFILETTRHPTLPPPDEIEKAFAAHQMKVLGPPLKVD